MPLKSNFLIPKLHDFCLWETGYPSSRPPPKIQLSVEASQNLLSHTCCLRELSRCQQDARKAQDVWPNPAEFNTQSKATCLSINEQMIRVGGYQDHLAHAGYVTRCENTSTYFF